MKVEDKKKVAGAMIIGGLALLFFCCLRRKRPPPEPEPDITLEPQAGRLGNSVDGRVAQVLWNQTWNQIHDGPGNQVDTDQKSYRIAIGASTYGDTWDAIHRIIQTFPTTNSPPGIIAANLRLYCRLVNIEGPNTPSIAIFESYPTTYNDLQLSDYGKIGSVPLSEPILLSSISYPGFLTIPLNDYGLTKIKSGQVTELALREATYDAANKPPIWTEHQDLEALFYSADHPNPDYHPKLNLFYS